jgi:hypothetical protein
VNDIERLAAALRIANEELEVEAADLSEAMEHGRRHLFRRLFFVGALSAVAASLLLSGGIAASHGIRVANQKDKKSKAEKPTNSGHVKRNGNGKKSSEKNKGRGDNKASEEANEEKRPEKIEAAVGPGEVVAEPLPNLIVTHLTNDEVVVHNASEVSTGPFLVVVKAEEPDGTAVEEEVEFSGLAAEAELGEKFKREIECKGLLTANADPSNQVSEVNDEDNEEIAKCEPIEDPVKKKEELEGDQKATTKGETSTTDAVTITNSSEP